MRTLSLVAGSKFVTITVDEKDHIGRIITTYNDWYEHLMLKDAVHRLRNYHPGSIVDVGAHIGNHALYLAATTGRQVCALEPYEPSYQMLVNNVKQNNLPITTWPCAAGAEPGGGSIMPPREGNSGTTAVVEDDTGDISIVPLDDLDVGDVAMIKIDTEDSVSGAVRVSEILLGATFLLHEYRPLLYIEGNKDQILSDLPRGYEYKTTFNRTPTHVFEHPGR